MDGRSDPNYKKVPFCLNKNYIFSVKMNDQSSKPIFDDVYTNETIVKIKEEFSHLGDKTYLGNFLMIILR